MIEIHQSIRFRKMLIMTFVVSLILGVLYFVSYPNFFGLKNISFSSFNKKSVEGAQEVLSSQQVSVFEKISKPIYGYPQKLSIESLAILLDIVQVGVDKDGFLETPKNWIEAGWYRKSAKPSEIGNLLINAHYDDSSGRPAAFWKLKNINVGDKVSVLDSYGRWFNYKVTNIFYLDINDPDRADVFKPYEEGKALMTLITCGGIWLPGDGTYSKRLVVNAELISD